MRVDWGHPGPVEARAPADGAVRCQDPVVAGVLVEEVEPLAFAPESDVFAGSFFTAGVPVSEDPVDADESDDFSPPGESFGPAVAAPSFSRLSVR